MRGALTRRGMRWSGSSRIVLAAASRARAWHEIERVEWRPHLDVIVEIHVHVAAASRRGCDAPSCERATRIAAGVDPHVAVQPGVDEVARDIEHLRPLARRVGDHQADVVLLQQGSEFLAHEARMPDLDGVAQRPSCVDGEARASGHAGIAPPGERQRLFRISRKELEERLEALGLEVEHFRETATGTARACRED